MVGFMLKYASTVRVKLTVALQSIPFTLESENSAILVPAGADTGQNLYR